LAGTEGEQVLERSGVVAPGVRRLHRVQDHLPQDHLGLVRPESCPSLLSGAGLAKMLLSGLFVVPGKLAESDQVARTGKGSVIWWAFRCKVPPYRPVVKTGLHRFGRRILLAYFLQDHGEVRTRQVCIVHVPCDIFVHRFAVKGRCL
jgi:hypothetical protein